MGHPPSWHLHNFNKCGQSFKKKISSLSWSMRPNLGYSKVIQTTEIITTQFTITGLEAVMLVNWKGSLAPVIGTHTSCFRTCAAGSTGTLHSITKYSAISIWPFDAAMWRGWNPTCVYNIVLPNELLLKANLLFNIMSSYIVGCIWSDIVLFYQCLQYLQMSTSSRDMNCLVTFL